MAESTTTYPVSTLITEVVCNSGPYSVNFELSFDGGTNYVSYPADGITHENQETSVTIPINKSAGLPALDIESRSKSGTPVTTTSICAVIETVSGAQAYKFYVLASNGGWDPLPTTIPIVSTDPNKVTLKASFTQQAGTGGGPIILLGDILVDPPIQN